MKKIVTILVLLVTFNFSFSQEENNKNSNEKKSPIAKKEKEYNTWSVNFNFGTNIPVGPFNEGYYALTDDFFTQPEFNHFDLNVRKMFNTKFGLMFDFGYDNFDNSNNSKPFSNNMYRTTLQGVMNLHHVLNFEEFTRKFGLQFHTGAGFSYLFAPNYTTTFNHYDNIFSVLTGMTGLIKISDRFAMNVDFTMSKNFSQHHTLDGTLYIDPINPSNARTGLVYNTTVGLTYYIGKKQTHADWYIGEKKEDKMDDLLARIQDLENKLKDTDGDGIPDLEDACVDKAGTKQLRKDGCPDSDGDGIVDCDDKCPTVKGPTENIGCPWPDTDGDGVTDNIDTCPTDKGEVNNSGCPLVDLDGDGKPDFDRDGDKVPDQKDKCPDVKGFVEYNGCLDIPAEDLKRLYDLSRVILFHVDKYSFQSRSYPKMDEVVAFMKEYPDARFSIVGHTDWDNTDSYNERLSFNRVTAVKNYLIKKGIDLSRLEIAWYGESRPIDTNTTIQGKANNRRVELNFIRPVKK